MVTTPVYEVTPTGRVAVLRTGIIFVTYRPDNSAAIFVPMKPKDIANFLADNGLPPFNP